LLIAASPLQLGADEPERFSPCAAVAFADDGRLVVARNGRLEIRRWPQLDIESTVSLPVPSIHDIAWAPTGKELAVAGGVPGDRGQLLILDWPSLAEQQSFSPHADVIYDVAWSGDGQWLLTAGADQRVGLIERQSGAVHQLSGHSRPVRAVAFLGESSLVSAGLDNSVRTWERETGKLRLSRDNHVGPVQDLAVRPGSGLPMIATAGSDKTVRMWQPTIGRHVRFARLPAPALAVVWSAAGDLLAATATDGYLYLIDPETVEIKSRHQAFDGWPYCLALAPDGRSVAVGGDHGQLVRVRLP
jgi:WD40 repeat protein